VISCHFLPEPHPELLSQIAASQNALLRLKRPYEAEQSLSDICFPNDIQEYKMQNITILKRLATILAVVAMFSTVSVQAQTQTQTSAPQAGNAEQTVVKGKLSAGDEKALKDMAQANINETAAARIALSKTRK